VQGKLLRLLQDRDFLRVGGSAPIAIDLRIVAATNRNLEKLVSSGRFRADLYFRIKVVELVLPPLRQRGPKDIARLAHHFAISAARRHGRPVPTLSKAALERLTSYRWPGNVRELENCIESAIVILDGSEIGPDELPLPERPHLLSRASETAPESEGEQGMTLEELERRHIERVLDRLGGNQTAAAKVLGIGRNTLGRKLKKYGL
jgi:Nif-specific regulatory protein